VCVEVQRSSNTEQEATASCSCVYKYPTPHAHPPSSYTRTHTYKKRIWHSGTDVVSIKLCLTPRVIQSANSWQSELSLESTMLLKLQVHEHMCICDNLYQCEAKIPYECQGKFRMSANKCRGMMKCLKCRVSVTFETFDASASGMSCMGVRAVRMSAKVRVSRAKMGFFSAPL
jgi:hypothetical protein